MESEKVKEIKKALELNKYFAIEYFHKAGEPKIFTFTDLLTLINELESENKRLRVVVDIANERAYRKKFIDEWRKEYQKELDKQGNGHIAGYPDFDLVYKLYFEQKDRIAELEEYIKGNEQDAKAFVNGWHKDLETELKQFAEKLKGKMYENENGYIEFLSGKIAVAVDIVDFENCLDETLKEFIK